MPLKTGYCVRLVTGVDRLGGTVCDASQNGQWAVVSARRRLPVRCDVPAVILATVDGLRASVRDEKIAVSKTHVASVILSSICTSVGRLQVRSRTTL